MGLLYIDVTFLTNHSLLWSVRLVSTHSTELKEYHLHWLALNYTFFPLFLHLFRFAFWVDFFSPYKLICKPSPYLFVPVHDTSHGLWEFSFKAVERQTFFDDDCVTIAGAGSFVHSEWSRFPNNSVRPTSPCRPAAWCEATMYKITLR